MAKLDENIQMAAISIEADPSLSLWQKAEALTNLFKKAGKPFSDMIVTPAGGRLRVTKPKRK